MTTVYKVVRRRWDGKLASVSIRQGSLLRIYEPKKPTHAINGMGLLAFSRMDEAHHFWPWGVRHHKVEVWKCKADHVTQAPPVLAYPYSGPRTRERFRRAWADPDFAHSCPWTEWISTPYGTVACDSITLIKRVDNGGKEC